MQRPQLPLLGVFGNLGSLLGGAGAVLRWTAMAFDSPVALLPVLQCLHGLSFGATHLGAMHALARLAHRQGEAGRWRFRR